MDVREAKKLLMEMRENTDQSLTGTQVAALAMAVCVLGALQPGDTRTVNALFANFFDE